MKIDLTNIPPEGKEIDLRLNPDWLEGGFGDNRIVGLEGSLYSRIKISPAGSKIIVEGFLSGRLVLRCDRCIEPFIKDLSKGFSVYVSVIPFKGGVEVELLEDDLDLDFLDGGMLDFDCIIREQLILAVPIKTLCRKECRGLCPVCGCNLNTSTCSCALKD